VSSANMVSLRVNDRNVDAIADGIYYSTHVYARQQGADYSGCLRRVLGKILSVVCVLVIRGQQAGCRRKKNDPRKDHAKQRQDIGYEPRMLTVAPQLRNSFRFDCCRIK